MDARRAMLIYNPRAGRAVHRRLVAEVRAALDGAGLACDCCVTAGRGHAVSLAARAVAEGRDLVIAAGGDGTVNEAVQALTGSRTALGVIPAGTVNLWASEIGMPRSPAALAHTLLHGQVRPVDVGRVGERRFLLMASMGLDATAIHAVSPALKQRWGRLAYGLALGRLARTYRGTPIRLVLDGKTFSCTALMLVIGNTQRYGGPFQATAHALADDGMLDVVVMQGHRVWQGLGTAAVMVSGMPMLRRHLMYGRARTITVECATPMHIQVDGEFYGSGSATFGVLAGGLRAVVGPRPRGLFAPDTPELLAWRQAATGRESTKVMMSAPNGQDLGDDHGAD
jgi:diacylglycerol kinase (ATP)